MRIILENPMFLLVWIFIPVVWILAQRSYLKSGSFGYRLKTGGLRTILILLLGLILSNPKYITHSDQVNIFYCLDASESITQEDKNDVNRFIDSSVKRMGKEDRAGLIVFGKQPILESPLKQDFKPEIIRADVNSNLTNISAALQMAIGKFPPEGENRIVIFTDGNENLSDSRDMAWLATSLGIEILPIPLGSRFEKSEVFVKGVDTPAVVPLETPFNIRVEISGSKNEQGELILYRDDGLLSNQAIEIKAGNNVFSFTDMIEEPGLYPYRAVINFPEDGFFQNNEGISYTKSLKKSRILYLSETKSPSAPVLQALEAQGIDITHKAVDEFSGSLNELLEYNAIIFDNVSGSSISFSIMENIEKYVKDLGGGLIMVGGDRSFGAGYYNKTPIEDVLPVYMDAPTDINFSRLTIIFVIDKSASMTTAYSGKSKLEMAKIAAFSSIEMLNPTDNIGILAFDSDYKWIVPVINARERQKIADNLSQIEEGGGTILYPALRNAFEELQGTKSQRKHIIVLSDGETNAADFEGLIESMKAENISVSTVCIGSHSDIELMKSIAAWGQGRFYYTDNPENIPNIFTGETKIVARKIISESPIQPNVVGYSEIMSGIETDVPVIQGQIITFPKPNADVVIRTIEGPLLATWRYGLGRSVAFTTDLSNMWGKEWVKWDYYGTFLAQMTKWAQRKETDATYTASIERTGEKGRFIINAITEQNRFINNLDMRVKMILPSGEGHIIELEQISPGRYQCEFPVEETGKYYFTLVVESEDEVESTNVFGFGFPYTDEFKVLYSNISLLESLAGITGGKVIGLEDGNSDLFRATQETMGYKRALWPYLLILFLILLMADVAVRKLLSFS